MSGKEDVFGAVDIANWEFPGENQATEARQRLFIVIICRFWNG